MTPYQYRISMGLCSCGEKVAPGKTLCYKCAQNNAAQAKIRAMNRTPEEKAKRAAYMKEYMKKPEQQKRIKERNKYYQRRYNLIDTYEEGYPWEVNK